MDIKHPADTTEDGKTWYDMKDAWIQHVVYLWYRLSVQNFHYLFHCKDYGEDDDDEDDEDYLKPDDDCSPTSRGDSVTLCTNLSPYPHKHTLTHSFSQQNINVEPKQYV